MNPSQPLKQVKSNLLKFLDLLRPKSYFLPLNSYTCPISNRQRLKIRAIIWKMI